MDPSIQWFIYGMVANEMATVEYCQAVYDQLAEKNVETFAQEILNLLAENYSTQEELDMVLESVQQLLNYSVEQSATGAMPELPGISATAQNMEFVSMDELPSLENIDAMSDEQLAETVKTMLNTLRALGASDLHLSAGSPPFIRRNLQIERLSNRPLTESEAERLNLVLLSPEQKEFFQKESDLSYALQIGNCRFRTALMLQKEGISGSYRLVPDRISKLEELGFLSKDIPTIKRLLDYHNGLLLVTGPLGSGKTSTLAAMVEVVNLNRHDHVITVEDPIEILIPSKNCNVTQRQIGDHTNSYHTALRGALREDPDVIVIGELHDLETIENAITASETGHLVIGTMHTGDSANTLNRLLDVFPPTQQPQIRAMTSGSLRGIICQRLVPGVSDKLELVYEILINTPAVASIIGDGKTHQLKATLQTGSKQGMCTMDSCIFEKFKAGLIGLEVALAQIKDQTLLKQIKDSVALAEARKLAEASKKKK